MEDKKRREIKEERTAASKLFENEDHSFTKEIYLDDVHYQDEEGIWQEMDDTLTEEMDEDTEADQEENMAEEYAASERAEKDFANRKGKWKVVFRKHSRKQGTVSVTKDAYKISWALENAEKVKAEETGTNTVLYPDILPGTDSRFYVRGKNIKEDIILKTPEAIGSFTWLYHTKKLHPVAGNSCVRFVNNAEEEVFAVAAPFMTDSAGKRSENIGIELLDEGKKDRCAIRITPDEEWLKDPERVYPVIVDPVTTTSKSRDEINDAHVDSQYAKDNFRESIILKTRGGDVIQRSYLKFKLPIIKTGDMVVSARLVMVSLAEDKKERTLQVHRVLQDWDSADITWFNKPMYSETVEDICKFTGDEQKYISLDITRLVKDWYQNGYNYGVLLRDCSELSGYTEYLSSDCHSDYKDMRPRIDISYVNYSGLEDYWTYHSQEAGRAGTVYVNDYNGNVIMQHNTMETGGSLMPMGLTQVYNSNDKDIDIGYGYGVRLNYHQTIRKVTIAGTEYYKHTDGDGTVHYFVYDSTKKKWKEETGLDLELILKTGDSDIAYVIKDKEENCLNFMTAGYLRSISDRHGNTLSLKYTNLRIASIADGAGRVTTLTYDTDSAGKANHLIKVTGPDQKSKTFAYTNGCLTSITDIDNSKTTYTYTTTRLLQKIRNVDESEVHYDYYSQNPYRVKKITEYGRGSKEGNSLRLTYGYNSTKFTDRKNRSEIFRFDNSGNLLHVHDGFGHAASARYSKDKNYTNRLQNETKLQSNIIQLLKDPIIQAKTLGWKSYVSDEKNIKASVNTDSQNVKTGTRSLQLTSEVSNQFCSWYQEVSLRKGATYTFSMYMKAVISEIGENGRCFARIEYHDKDGKNVYAVSEGIRKSTGGFIRQKATFKVPEDAADTKVRVFLYMYRVKGTVYGDMTQLECGTTANRCNLIDNGDFYFGSTQGFTGSGTTLADELTTVGTSVYVPVRYAMMVITDFADVYTTPKVSAETKITSIFKNECVVANAFLKDSSGNLWYYVKTRNGQKGYVRSESLCIYMPGGSASNSACTAVENVILRSAPSASAIPVQEGIEKNTCLALRSSVKDSSGNKWYEAGLDIDGKRYYGYISADSVVRLATNTPYGYTYAPVNCYTTPSTVSGLVTLPKDKRIRIRGTVTKNNGEVWYAFMPENTEEKKFAYILNTALTISKAPVTDREATAKVNERVPGLDNHIFKFVGDYESEKRLVKKLDLTGKRGDTYMVNAWGFGTTLPESSVDKGRRFGVEVVFISADGKTKDTHYSNFSPDILDWQFLSDVYVAKNDYASIQVAYTYCHNANLAFVDGIALFREEFGQTYTYDAENNLISVTDAQKNRQKFEYNATGDVTGITDPKGNNFKYEYDAKRRLRTATSAERVRYRLKYDTKGNIVESGCISAADTTETKGTWVARKFTEKKNHVAGVTDTEGNTVSYEWDETTDLLKSLTDGRGNKISYRYDAAQRLSAVSQKVTIGNAQKTVTNAYTYKNDRLASISHNGFAYGFTYDAFGNMLRASIDKKETDAEYSHELVRYEYEEKNGNLAKTIYSNGDYIRYEYDSMDRIQMSYYHSASASAEKRMNHYVYDRSGNLAKVQAYLAGKTYDLEYDFLDRLMRVTDESGQRYQYFYDANNNMTELRVYSDEYGTKTNYSYDKDSRETKTKIMSGKERTVTYDSCGRVVKTEWNTTSPLTVAYGYYSPDKQVGTLPRKITVGSRILSYTYDANGNITAITDTKGSSTVKESYVYDELNRLIRENSQTQKKTFTYEYDLGGNLVKVCEYPYTTGTLPTKPSATETGTFGQVWRDKLMKWNGVVMQYDSIGNMTQKGNTTFTWTQGRKLESVNNGKKIRYYYDHAGNRVKKTVDNVTTEYCMAGDLLVTEKGEGRRIWYYYDSAANPVSMRVSGKDYFYVRNLQNDVIALIDDAGETVVEYKYNSWGKILSITGSKASTIGKINPFRYRGYYYDEETGMYYLKNRYYDPEIRRFISADNFKSEKASMETLHNRNLFAYCDDNPLVRADQDGNAWMVAAASFVAGMGLSVGCQMIFEGKNLSEINWITAASAGLGTAMGFLGIGGSTTGAVVSGVTSFASDYYENRDFTSAVINGAVSAGISLILNPLASMGPEKRGYLEYMRKDYHNANRKILNMNLSFSEALPLRSAVNEEKSRKIRQLAEEEISSYCGDYACNAFVNSNIAIRKYGRVIGGGCEYTPGKGTRYMKCYKYLGKLYWVYV